MASRTATEATDLSKLSSAISLVGELIEEISPKFFEEESDLQPSTSDQFCSTLADSLYEASDMKTALIPETDGRELLVAGFGTVLRLALRCSQQLQESTPTPALVQLLLSTLSLVGIFSNAASYSPETLLVDWSPQEWIVSFMKTLSIDPASPTAFPLHSAIVQAILTLARTSTLSPIVEKNERSVVQALTDKVSRSVTHSQKRAEFVSASSFCITCNPAVLPVSSSRCSFSGASRSSRIVVMSSL